MTDSILEQARLAHSRADLRRALELSDKGLAENAGELSPGDRRELCALKSHCLSAFGRWQEALESGATPNYQVCLANIGNVYLCRREFLMAISYYQRALELARQLGDQLSIGKWLRNLGQAYSHLGNAALAQGFEYAAKLVNDRLAEERERASQVAASFK